MEGWGGTLALRHGWDAGRTNHATVHDGTFRSTVVPSAYAVLWTGTICTSGYPTDFNYIG